MWARLVLAINLLLVILEILLPDVPVIKAFARQRHLPAGVTFNSRPQGAAVESSNYKRGLARVAGTARIHNDRNDIQTALASICSDANELLMKRAERPPVFSVAQMYR